MWQEDNLEARVEVHLLGPHSVGVLNWAGSNQAHHTFLQSRKLNGVERQIDLHDEQVDLQNIERAVGQLARIHAVVAAIDDRHGCLDFRNAVAAQSVKVLILCHVNRDVFNRTEGACLYDFTLTTDLLLIMTWCDMITSSFIKINQNKT